jgi:hypothetical protein
MQVTAEMGLDIPPESEEPEFEGKLWNKYILK